MARGGKTRKGAHPGTPWNPGPDREPVASPRLPLRVDLEASVVTGEGVVVDRGGASLVLDSIEEAISFAAAANGESEEGVLARARALQDAIDTMRRTGGHREPGRT